MSSFEDTLRIIIREELFREKLPKRLRFRALAQEILDEVKPGETVQEILINTDTAESIKDLLEKSKDIIENAKKQPPAKKTVYTIMYRSQLRGGRFWPTTQYPQDHDTFESAVDLIQKEQIGFYFIKQHEVDA